MIGQIAVLRRVIRESKQLDTCNRDLEVNSLAFHRPTYHDANVSRSHGSAVPIVQCDVKWETLLAKTIPLKQQEMVSALLAKTVQPIRQGMVSVSEKDANIVTV